MLLASKAPTVPDQGSAVGNVLTAKNPPTDVRDALAQIAWAAPAHQIGPVACEVAQRGIDAAAGLKSARSAEYLRQLRAKLAPYEATAAVTSFNERATLARLS